MSIGTTVRVVQSLGLLALVAGCDPKMDTGDGGGNNGNGNGNSDDMGGSGQVPGICQGEVVPYGEVAGGHNLDGDETWSPDKVYFVFGHLDLGSHTLTITAGTTVCFANALIGNTQVEGTIEIGTAGSLKILGTADRHVTLRKGNVDGWAGFSAGSDYKELTFKYADFIGATLGGTPAIGTTDGEAPAITAEEVTFKDSVNGPDVLIQNRNGFTPSSKLTFANLTVKDAASQYAVAQMDIEAASHLTANQIVMNPEVPQHARVVQFTRQYVKKDLTLHKLAVPYRTSASGIEIFAANSSDPTPALTIEAGTTVQVWGAPIYAGGATENGIGDLIAVGTEAEPIVFASIEDKPMPGDWSSLMFWPGYFDPARSKLDHVRIENAGSPDAKTNVVNCHDTVDHNNFGAAVVIGYQSGDVLIEGPSITHTAFTNIQGEAIRGFCASPTHCLKQDYTAPAFGNTFTNVVSKINQATTGGSCN